MYRHQEAEVEEAESETRNEVVQCNCHACCGCRIRHQTSPVPSLSVM